MELRRNACCPFQREVGDPAALANCPEVYRPCPCVQELLRHALGEVDAQTVTIVMFWQPLDTMACDSNSREILPQQGREGNR